MFDRLKSLFIIEDEDLSKKSQNERSASSKEDTKATISSRPKPVTSSPTPSSGKVSSKFTNILFGAMEKNDQEGFDYLEYKQSLQNLSKMQMDEATRFKSAYAMAQTMGVTAHKLVESARFYVGILNGEKDKFQRAVDNQEEKQIGDRKQTQSRLAAMIKEKEQQIQQMTKEIEDAKKKQKQIEQEINEAHDKVVSTKNDFFASFQSLVGQIQKDIENMERYLK